MTAYRYAATDLVTGAVLADTLPLTVDSWFSQLNGSGTMSGELPLSKKHSDNIPWLNALLTARTVLWALADGYPVWAGGLWDRPDSTRQEGTTPLQAQTADFLFSRRVITADLEYGNVDLFTVFLDLLRYGLTKTSPYIAPGSPETGPPSSLYASMLPVARLVLPGPAALSGIPWSASYPASSGTTVAAAWADLVQGSNLEFAFAPGRDQHGKLAIFVLLAVDSLGRKYPQAGYSVTYPGNAIDYGWPETGSQAANVVLASASPNGAPVPWESQYPHGYDLGALRAGNPVLETTVAWEGSVITQQSSIDSYADGQLAATSQGVTTPTFLLNGNAFPGPLSVVLGDIFPAAVTSDRHPRLQPGKPGLTAMLRLTGVTVSPPNASQAHTIQLATSQILAGITP